MKKYIVPFLLTAILLSATMQVWNIRADEYFADGVMVRTRGKNFVGLIMAWGVYGIYGGEKDCRIVPIYSPVGDAVKVECVFVYNDKETIFRGWYNFRGHPRPICGAIVKDNFPRYCRGDK